MNLCINIYIHTFRAKPRMTTVSGRRTYTEEELQKALQDILTGKLGTRRAAVLYGIPRSTLRNKVYKLAMEQKREASINAVPVLGDEDDDGSGAEDEKEVEKTLNALPSEDMFRLGGNQSLAALHKFGKLYESNSQEVASEMPVMPAKRQSPPPTKPQTPAMPANLLDTNMLLQGLLLSGSLNALNNNKIDQNLALSMLPELFRTFLMQTSEGELIINLTCMHVCLTIV